MLAAFVMVSVWAGFPVLIWLPAAVLDIFCFAEDRIEISYKLRLVLLFTAAIIACWQIAVIFPGVTGRLTLGRKHFGLSLNFSITLFFVTL